MQELPADAWCRLAETPRSEAGAGRHFVTEENPEDTEDSDDSSSSGEQRDAVEGFESISYLLAHSAGSLWHAFQCQHPGCAACWLAPRIKR